MTELTLTKLQISEGVWTGRLTGAPQGATPPALEITHLDQPVPNTRLVQDPGAPGSWTVTVPIPAAALCEGIQTILIRDGASGARLSSFAILTGEPLEDDIRTEVDLLRAELDLLKKAFRRHCSDSAD